MILVKLLYVVIVMCAAFGMFVMALVVAAFGFFYPGTTMKAELRILFGFYGRCYAGIDHFLKTEI